MGLLSLTACTHKETGPSIDEVVGEYNASLKWTGGSGWDVYSVKKFTVSKSATESDVLIIDIIIDEYTREAWKINYLKGGSLAMKRQVLYENPTIYGYTTKKSQEATGNVKGDSLFLDGEIFFEPNNIWGQTFCKYRAKKKR